MSHGEILLEACSKAYLNGWRDNGAWYRDGELTVWTEEHSFELIFSHDFARYIWGEDQCINGVPVTELMKIAIKAKPEDGAHTVQDILGIPSQKMYLWHLQQMVIADDPLAYLAANL